MKKTGQAGRPNVATEREIMRDIWELSSDEDILTALFTSPDEYKPEALEIIRTIAKERGIDNPDPALLETLSKADPADQPAEEPGREVEVLDRSLTCRVCDHNRFRERNAQLNTALASFFGVEWMNRSARCFVCARCGYIHWFM